MLPVFEASHEGGDSMLTYVIISYLYVVVPKKQDMDIT